MTALSAPPLYPSPPPYTDRASKQRYIAARYASILATSVLDVGCDQKALQSHLHPATRYLGIDIAPPADVVLNLDRPGATLPFTDASFDTVLCADVLEHLERIHAIFDELCRVAAQRVIISLPNPVHNLVDALRANSGGVLKFYGLPIDPPADRHRWFFGADEAATFLRERGRRNRFHIEHLDHTHQPCPKWLVDSHNLLDHPNITAGTTWCVLKRSSAS